MGLQLSSGKLLLMAEIYKRNDMTIIGSREEDTNPCCINLYASFFGNTEINFV